MSTVSPNRCAAVAQRGEAIGEARFIRIVSGGEHVARAELRRRFEERGKGRQVGRRNEARAARIEHLDAGVAQAGERFAAKRRILEQRRGIAPRLAIEKPHADEVESGTRRRPNHRGRRELGNGVVREGKWNVAAARFMRAMAPPGEGAVERCRRARDRSDRDCHRRTESQPAKLVPYVSLCVPTICFSSASARASLKCVSNHRRARRSSNAPSFLCSAAAQGRFCAACASRPTITGSAPPP